MTSSRPLAVVTGANSGVGFETARRLASVGWGVVLVCRSPERGREARERLTGVSDPGALELELADLAELARVRALAGRLLDRHPRLDGLVLNAGLYAPERRLTDDGFELTMAVNHLAHVLLTSELLPPLLAAGGRVVSVTSVAHRRAEPGRAPFGAILEGGAWRDGLTAYGDSKLANLLFAREFDRRLQGRGVRADAVHPGVLATRIWDRARGLSGLLVRAWRLFMDRPDVGGEAVSRLLLDPRLRGGGGRYFEETEEVEPSSDARDPVLAARLWEVSVEALEAAGFRGVRSLPGPPPGGRAPPGRPRPG